MKINYSNIFLFVVFSVFMAFLIGSDFKKETPVSFLFIIIIYQSLFSLFFVGMNSFNLLKVFFVFQLLFMGVIPFSEYNNEIVYWTSRGFNEFSYLCVNVIIILINFSVIVVYSISSNTYKKMFTDKGAPSRIKYKLTTLNRCVLVCISTLCVFMTLYLNNFSLLSILFRGGDFKEGNTNIVSSISLILTNISKFMPFFCFMYAINTERKDYIILTFLFFTLIFCAFPLGIPRFMVAAIYLPIIFRVFPAVIQGSKGIVGLVFSILFVFPFLDQFRRFEDELDIKIIPDLAFFTKGHFDSYQSLLRVFDENIITYGNQLLGVFLFFIPRAIWVDKPIGSGHYIAIKFDYILNNVSMNYFGEGFINFGVVGILLFAIVIGLVCAFLDCKFWVLNQGNVEGYNNSIYFFLLGYLIFMMRGDLLSSFAFLISAFFSFLLVNVTTGLTIKLRQD